MAIKPVEPLPENLQAIQKQMEGYAKDYGLDFYKTVFELVDCDQLNAVAACGAK